MRAVVVFALHPGPQAPVQLLQAVGVAGGQVGQQLRAHGSEPTFLLALALGLVGSGMDQRHAQAGTDQGQLVRTVVGAVVHVQALRDAAAQQGLLEHGQEGLRVLGQAKGAVRHQPGGVIEESDEVGLAPDARVRHQHAGAVHDVAHPQLAGVGEVELAALGVGGGLGQQIGVASAFADQAGAAEQPVYGGGGQR